MRAQHRANKRPLIGYRQDFKARYSVDKSTLIEIHVVSVIKRADFTICPLLSRVVPNLF